MDGAGFKPRSVVLQTQPRAAFESTDVCVETVD